MRRKLGFTQDKMAEVLCMDVSCYCRRESGQIKISAEQWLKIAKTLGVSIEDIYQSDDELVAVINSNYSTKNERVVGQYSLPEEVLGMYYKHIEVLETELDRLKELLKLAAQ
jgi:DNA-binding XRE family transcriptional regulator